MEKLLNYTGNKRNKINIIIKIARDAENGEMWIFCAVLAAFGAVKRYSHFGKQPGGS